MGVDGRAAFGSPVDIDNIVTIRVAPEVECDA